MHPILNYALSSKKKLNKAMRESIACVLRTMTVKRATKAMKAGIVMTPERIYLTAAEKHRSAITTGKRRGKAPPIDSFTGENPAFTEQNKTSPHRKRYYHSPLLFCKRISQRRDAGGTHKVQRRNAGRTHSCPPTASILTK